MPSSKGSQPCGYPGDSRGGGWTGQGASSVERGPERLLLVVGGRTVSDRPDPVHWQGRGAFGTNWLAQVRGRPRGPISVPSCPASSSGSGPRSTLLAPRPVHPPPRESQAMPEARASSELGIQASSLVTFFWAQKKVTRPPGGIRRAAGTANNPGRRSCAPKGNSFRRTSSSRPNGAFGPFPARRRTKCLCGWPSARGQCRYGESPTTCLS